MTWDNPKNLPKDDKSIEYAPKGGTPFHRCGVCDMYRSPNQCTIVQGFIAEYGHCKRFVKKRTTS